MAIRDRQVHNPVPTDGVFTDSQSPFEDFDVDGLDPRPVDNVRAEPAIKDVATLGRHRTGNWQSSAVMHHRESGSAVVDNTGQPISAFGTVDIGRNSSPGTPDQHSHVVGGHLASFNAGPSNTVGIGSVTDSEPETYNDALEIVTAGGAALSYSMEDSAKFATKQTTAMPRTNAATLTKKPSLIVQAAG